MKDTGAWSLEFSLWTDCLVSACQAAGSSRHPPMIDTVWTRVLPYPPRRHHYLGSLIKKSKFELCPDLSGPNSFPSPSNPNLSSAHAPVDAPPPLRRLSLLSTFNDVFPLLNRSNSPHVIRLSPPLCQPWATLPQCSLSTTSRKFRNTAITPVIASSFLFSTFCPTYHSPM